LVANPCTEYILSLCTSQTTLINNLGSFFGGFDDGRLLTCGMAADDMIGHDNSVGLSGLYGKRLENSWKTDGKQLESSWKVL
jgi:hypothetical protein